MLLGIDGGQTSTTTALARPDGTVVWRGIGGRQDHLGLPGGMTLLRDGLAEAIAGMPPTEITSAVAGMTNVDDPDPRTGIVAGAIRELIAVDHVRVTTDRVSCWAGASGGRPSALVIAGGGAISYGDNGRGQTAYSGGWGYLLGDEGSATHVGLQAIRAALRDCDGRGEPTALTELVRTEFAVPDLVSIKPIIYDAAFSRARFGALAPKVVALAGTDRAAAEIVAAAGRELALLARAVLAEIFEPDEPTPVHLVGGMFAAGAPVLDPLRAELARTHPAALAANAPHAPLLGALVLAATDSGIAVDEKWLARAGKSLGETPGSFR
jgi:N-acetylglucosamine kinase-like BadF-type ATPase